MPYSSYDAYLSATSSTVKAKFNDDLQQFVNRDFDIASSYEVVQYLDRDIREYNNLEVRITQAISSKTGIKLYDDFKTIIFKDLSFKTILGDMFQFANYYWMVINTSNTLTETSSCVVRKCNHTLKWYNDATTPVLVEQSCVIDYFKFRTYDNVEESKYLITGANTRYVLLASNDESEKLIRDQRFIIDGRAYKVTDYDTVTLPGIHQLTLEEHQINMLVDDQNNEIANSQNNIPIDSENLW